MRYYLLDGAKCNDALDDTLKCAPKYLSLYKGRSEENLASVAPYLAETNDLFNTWIIENGWGDSWGYFIECDLPFEALYGHLRKFLIVETEDFKPLYFRFYDPRVIRLFLPTCSTAQLETLLGPIDRIICEAIENKNEVEIYSLQNGKLKFELQKLTAFFTIQPANSGNTEVPMPLISGEKSGENKPDQSATSGISNATEDGKKKRKFIY